MTKFKSIFLLTITVIGLFSCRRSNSANHDIQTPTASPATLEVKKFPSLEPGVINLSEKDFGELIELTGTPIQSDVIFNPLEMEMIVKRNVLIMKSKVTNGMIKFLRLTDFTLINEVGNRGRGPGELQNPRLIATSEPDLLCYLYDTRVDKVFQIDTNFVLKETGFPLFKPANELFGNKQFVEMGSRDFYYVSNSTTGKGIYHYVPVQPDSLKMVYDLEDGFKMNLSWASLIGAFGGNQDKNRLVYAYKYFHQITFFDPTNFNSRVLKFDIPTDRKAVPSDPVNALGPTNISHYLYLSVQPEGVFCTYSGRTPIEVKREMDNGDADYLFVEQFDWNGHPVKKFRLDHWGYFCVDEERRCIYVAATNSEEVLYRYQF